MKFELRGPRPQSPIHDEPFHAWELPGESPSLLFFRSGSGYLLRFPDLADFAVSADGLEVSCDPAPSVSRLMIQHLYVNQVQPLALSRQKVLVLHGSAVQIDEHAVAFLGVSGQGKSTLATSFATCGHPFLTDDGLQIESLGTSHVVNPGHPSIRLWRDSSDALVARTHAPVAAAGGKARLFEDDGVNYCAKPRPLGCLFILGRNQIDRVTIAPINPRDAVIELVSYTFVLDIEERELLSHHFGRLSMLAQSQPVFRLDYPRRYNYLATVRQAVIAHARSGIR